jgi:hypothetical protein
MILDARTATPAMIARVARELPGATAATLVNAFPVLEPEGAYVPGGMRNGAKRYTDALQRRGLARPDPDGVWWGFVTVAGMLVRDHLMRTALRERGELLEQYREYVRHCPMCYPEGQSGELRHGTTLAVDTHIRGG